MKEIILAGVLAAVVTAGIVASPASLAADAGEQVALCAAALDAQGLAAASDYRAKLLKTKGGSVQTVTIKLVPTSDGAEAIEAECEIRRGEVVNAAVKA